MGSLCSKPSTPPPVDYTAAANAQGTANVATAEAQARLNNPNMITPYGNQTYVMGPDGRPTLTQTLSPDEQNKLNLTNSAQISGLNILNSDIPNISAALSGPFGMAGSAQGIDPSQIGTARTSLGNTGNIQTGLNYGGAPGMPSNSIAAALQAQNADYQKGAQYLDPQWRIQEEQTASGLANQGIMPGTQAYNDAMLMQSNAKQQAYGDLQDRAIAAGNTENQAQFERGLQARQEGVGEITTQGQFANSAQQQQLADAMAKYNAYNQGVGQNASLAQMIQQANNAARGQNYSEYTNNRTMPLNMFNSLLTSGQVQNPTFQSTQPTSIAPPPILTGAQLQGQQNAAIASANSAGTGQTTGLIGAGLTAAAIAF